MTNSSSLLASLFGKTLSFTLRGMTVTLGSTIISCYVACKIEQGANQLIYKYMPYKFAEVEYANGLTQEQLDAVKLYYGHTAEAEEQQQQEQDPMKLVTSVLNTAAEEDQRLQSQQQEDEKQQQQQQQQEQKLSYSTLTSFWIEKKKEELSSLPSLSSIPLGLPQQEILACAMTG
jgi:hypothetical protein